LAGKKPDGFGNESGYSSAQVTPVKNPFQIGDVKTFLTKVTEAKLAQFEAGRVHAVYSTFAVAQDAEWCCRLFVLDMLESGEEGVGSFIDVRHLSPALLGSDVRIEAKLMRVEGNMIRCSYKVWCSERLIAEGEQEQRILDRVRFEKLLRTLSA